jgi:hypothetical protein
MPSFKIRNSRTKLHNSDGSRIYNTFNSTGLVNKYQSQNSRFNARNNTGRTSDIIDPATGEPYNNCSCTIAGCGKQCCRNYFLIENITQDIWYDTLDSGTVFQPGNIVSTAYVVSNIPNPPFKEIGIIEDIIFPNAYECIPLGQTRAESKDCSGAFPLNVRLIIRSSGESCVLDSKQHYIGPGIFGLFFKQPNQSQSPTTGVWSGMPNASNLYIQHEEYKVLGSSRVGAPYRNPIAGYRKTLACCCKSNKGSQPCYKGCKGACYIELVLQTAKQFKTPRPMRNDYIYLSDGKFFGYVTDFGYNTNGAVLRFSFNNNTECTKNQQKLNSLYPSGQITLYRANGSLYQDNTFIINNFSLKEKLCTSKEATNDVYKDSYAISCQQDTRVCYDRRIRSGMQPNQQFCVEYIKKMGQDGNIYWQKHKRLLCPPGASKCKDPNKKEASCRGWQKAYSYSYSQYNKNRAMNTYERGLEKNLPIQDDSNSSCPQGEKCKKSLYPNSTCCEKSQYRKSGGNACISCLPTNNPSANLLSKNAVTVWKPNNKKFKVQGAVCAGSRMERLKLDTIRSANSKCKRGETNERCHPDGNGKGKYFAGKPRFTGWIYNRKHQERVWPNRNISAIRYRPQPFGIPQLTNKGRSTRPNHGQPTWKPHSSGTYGYNQRTDSHNIRAPGYGNKCVANCPMPDCVKPIGKRTFEEWMDEYEGVDNARYQGNRKCQEKATFSIKTVNP